MQTRHYLFKNNNDVEEMRMLKKMSWVIKMD